MSAGNPVVTAPDGDTLDRGLTELELLVCIDMFANETSSEGRLHPAGDDVPGAQGHPADADGLHAPPVGPGDQGGRHPTRPRSARSGGSSASWAGASASTQRSRRTTRRAWSTICCGAACSPTSSAFVTSSRPSRISRTPTRTGSSSATPSPSGSPSLGSHIADKKVHIGDAEILEPLQRLSEIEPASPDEMWLIGRRDLRSINSWMHAKPERGPGLYVHPIDAERLGVADGDRVRVNRDNKHVEVPIEITDRIMPGVVSYPHGWDERRTAGVNINRLLSAAVEHKDSVSGASHLDGVPVRVESCTSVAIVPTPVARYEHDAARHPALSKRRPS